MNTPTKITVVRLILTAVILLLSKRGVVWKN